MLLHGVEGCHERAFTVATACALARTLGSLSWISFPGMLMADQIVHQGLVFFMKPIHQVLPLTLHFPLLCTSS